MLRSTFLSFETAKRALNVSQLGLDTVGHNISNAQTPGYTRQRVDQVSISSGGYATKYQIRGGQSQFSGQGSLTNGISQIRDPFLDTRYRNEASKYGEQAIKSGGLTDLENVLDEISTDGVSAQMANFIAELTKYADDASSAELATVVRNSAAKLVQVIKKTASELSEVLATQKGDLETAISTDVNIVLEQIANLNKVIREDNIYGNPSLELNDTRNMLIDQLAEFLPIKVVNTPEKVSDDLTISNLSIVLVDNSSVPALEIPLVQGKECKALDYSENPDGTVKISLQDGHTSMDLTSKITEGAIKGYLDIINGKGDYAQTGENSFRGVPYYMKALDTFTQVFANQMNKFNSITPDEALGQDNVEAYLNKNLFTNSKGGTDVITASDLQISEEWMKNANFFTTSKLTPSSPQVVTDEQGNTVYDLQGNPTYKTTANADNINKFVEMLKGSTTFSTGYKGSFQEYLGSMQSDLSLDQQLTTTLLTASTAVISGFADQRDAVSAVSIDEEAMNMMIYQNFYNAAARYMTTIDEALGTIIQGMGVVGR